jgi:hypothetical protein
MKKSLILVSLLVGTMGVYAQGTLDWNSQNNWLISIYSPSTATPSVIQTGDSPLDVPAGSATYSGGFIGGTASSPGAGVGGTPSSGPGGYNYQTAGNFEVGLYVDTSAGAVQTDITTGTPIATVGINDGSLGTSTLATSPTIAGGTEVNVGLAAWYTGAGTITSYAAAVTASDPAGFNVSTGQIALGTQTGTPVLIGPSLGLTSFSLATNAVPEPSTIALGIVGASAFLMRLRRKQ